MEPHHPHHLTHKKKWGEYLLEFFMLFFAVFLGFVAENIRENIVEKQRETQYVFGFVQDLKSDSTLLNRQIKLNLIKELEFDSLLKMKHTDLSNQDNIRKVYSYFSRGSGYPIFTPSDATISQLKNGGAFRLIKKNVSDSILAYDNFNKEIITHNDQYLKVHNEFWDETYNIIDVSIFRDTNFLPHDQYFGMSLVYYSLIWKNSRLPLISSNKKDKQRFFGLLMRLLSFNGANRHRMIQQKERAVRLILFLNKEYHL